MKTVWVVMSNDYPDSVWDNEAAANEYVTKKYNSKKKQRAQKRFIYWRAYPFAINAPTKFGET